MRINRVQKGERKRRFRNRFNWEIKHFSVVILEFVGGCSCYWISIYKERIVVADQKGSSSVVLL